MRAELVATLKALRRLGAARNRSEAARARVDTRDWVMKRRERTRQLIELGGLVAKAGLIELTDDDRAAIYGAFLDVAAKLRGEERAAILQLWRHRGRQELDIDLSDGKGATFDT